MLPRCGTTAFAAVLPHAPSEGAEVERQPRTKLDGSIGAVASVSRPTDRSGRDVRVVRRLAGPSRQRSRLGTRPQEYAPRSAEVVLLWVARRVSELAQRSVRALRSSKRSAAILTQRRAGSVLCRRAPRLLAEERCSTSYKDLTAVGPRRRGFAAVLNDSEGETAPRAHHHALPGPTRRRRAPPHRPATLP